MGVSVISLGQKEKQLCERVQERRVGGEGGETGKTSLSKRTESLKEQLSSKTAIDRTEPQ